IWADAVCINQEDNQEKAVQVRMMTRIYESASHVVASLGVANAERHHALQTLLQIAATNKLSKIPSSIPRIDDNVWDEISTLIRRPWFARVW
ncbi:heterokaryon incompatibility, partial [Leptodontidium sp. 2 PMI_412]